MPAPKHEQAGPLSPEQISKVFELAVMGYPQTVIAERFGVSQPTISKLLRAEAEAEAGEDVVELSEQTPGAIVEEDEGPPAGEPEPAPAPEEKPRHRPLKPGTPGVRRRVVERRTTA